TRSDPGSQIRRSQAPLGRRPRWLGAEGGTATRQARGAPCGEDCRPGALSIGGGRERFTVTEGALTRREDRMRSMRQSATAPKLVLAWFGVALLAACSEGAGPDIPSASPDTRITVSNDAAALASRVQLSGGQPVDLDPSGLPASAQAA